VANQKKGDSMKKLIRVRTPEFVREMNIFGYIVRGQVDDKGPYIDITEDQEDEFRRQIREMREAAEFGEKEEVPAGQQQPEIETELDLSSEQRGAKPEEDGKWGELEADKRTQTLNVADAAQLVSTINDVNELARLKAGEESHPDYPGGRKGVMTYIDQRSVELVNSNQ
jgi:hypothetical protein